MAEEDLIFGKNRHLFGGIEPSNMRAFNVARDNSAGKIAVTATLPTDTIINGQTLCTVAGAVIRRSDENYPKDEFSGEFVADISSSGTFYDEEADIDGTYFYAAFPYTTQGVYNRNPANRKIYNEPQPLTSFTASSVYSTATRTAVVKLSVTLPEGIAGAVIRRSTTGYPTNENDGDEVAVVSSSGTYDDPSVVLNTMYYYSAFPFTSTDHYNYAESNRVSIKPAAVIENMDPMAQFSASSEYNVQNGTAAVKIAVRKPSAAIGVIIRRSTSGYPETENDGDEIASVTTDGTITDSNVSVGTTYYYSAFPYTNGGYSRRTENRTSCTPTTADDTLAAMPSFTSKSVYNSTTRLAEVQLTVAFPTNAVGVIIRKSTSSYPTSETDGSAVTSMTTAGTYTDTAVSDGTTYYYSAFPYSVKGVSRRTENRTTCIPKKYEYLYGFDINMSDSNPATRVSYPSDVDNAGFTPAKMNYSSNRFEYGSWPSSGKFMPKPCMLTFGGVVDHYLDPNNYGKKTDGSASKVADISFNGNAMMEWPKIYTKRWEANGVYHFRCSDVKIDDDWECWCNYDKNNNEIPHFYTPIYFGSKDSSNRMRSISGQSHWTNTGGAQNEIDAAKRCGADIWYIECLADRLLIQDLLVMIGKSTDGQTVFGMGFTDDGWEELLSSTGNANNDSKGLFYGVNNGNDYVKVFGMMHWWGNIWRRTAGWISVSGTQKVKLTRGTKDGSTATDYNLDGSGYISTSVSIGNHGGYISAMTTKPYGRLPSAVSGSSSTYEADCAYSSGSGTGYAYVGGDYSDDLRAGPFFVFLHYAASYSDSPLGAALSCKPLAS